MPLQLLEHYRLSEGIHRNRVCLPRSARHGGRPPPLSSPATDSISATCRATTSQNDGITPNGRRKSAAPSRHGARSRAPWTFMPSNGTALNATRDRLVARGISSTRTLSTTSRQTGATGQGVQKRSPSRVVRHTTRIASPACGRAFDAWRVYARRGARETARGPHSRCDRCMSSRSPRASRWR